MECSSKDWNLAMVCSSTYIYLERLTSMLDSCMADKR